MAPLRLRVVEVRVQPVIVADDGVNLTPIEHGTIAIPAAEWPTYSSVRFPAELADFERRLNEEEAAGEKEEKPSPARASSVRGRPRRGGPLR